MGELGYRDDLASSSSPGTAGPHLLCTTMAALGSPVVPDV